MAAPVCIFTPLVPRHSRRVFDRTVKIALILVCALLLAAATWWVNQHIAPLVFNSRIECLAEKSLPKITVERGSSVYCRMKADDFRFPLPSGSRATNLVVTGGSDTIDGSVEARFDRVKRMTAIEYETSLSGKVQIGGQVTAQEIPEGLLIKFHYFGDR